MRIFNQLSRLVAAGLLVTGVAVTASGTPASAATPAPSLTLVVDGDVIRDSSVVESGTTVTAVAGGVLNPGDGGRELRIDLDPATVYQAGGVTAPEGWAVGWSTGGGGTWVGGEPRQAGDVTTVSDLGETNRFVVEFANSGR